MDRRTLVLSGLAALGSVGAAAAQPDDAPPQGYGDPEGYDTPPPPAPQPQGYDTPSGRPASTYTAEEMVAATSDFLGVTAEAAGGAIERVFGDYGQPTAYIAGEEAAGAITVGLRYGRGLLYMKDRAPSEVFWQGPSIGFDLGGNASRVFTLCYNLHYADMIYRRYPGVEGSAYVVGGLGVNYQRAEDIILAPIRAGVGLRLGANVGYLSYSRKRRWIPF